MNVKLRWTGRSAFTLIELLVVVAIIALLISILLPSLSAAKEKARIVKCLSNLKEISNAMNMYFMDEKDWFPFEKRNWPSTAAPLHAFYYGGHPGRKYSSTEWWGYVRRPFRDSPAGRPFNNYLYQNLSSRVDDPRERRTPEFQNARKMPVFECPSDLGGFWNTQTDIESHIHPTYFTCGSSYDCNYHFVWEWGAGGGRPYRDRYLELANHFLLKQREQNISNFVILFEDPFDSAQWESWNRIGWHKQLNMHTFLFLDGHAAYTLAETTNGRNRGPGWKTSAGRLAGDFTPWWEDPEDPDYVYRDLGPR